MTDRLNQIRLPSLGRLRRYLRADGWIEELIPDRHAALYFKMYENFGKIELVLPSSARPGTDTAVAQAIRTLASVEMKEPSEIAQAVWAIAFDLIETIIPTHSMFLESISLQLAEQTLRSVRRVLGRNAQAELNTTSGVNGDPADFLSSCKFAHTFSGSFGFRIESPIGPNPEDDITKQPVPFERRVTERLARGLRSLSQAAQERSPRAIVENFGQGFDSATCNAIISYFEESKIKEITLQCAFSKAWIISPDIDRMTSVAIHANLVPLMKEASTGLKESEFYTPVIVSGRIIGLSSKYSPDDVTHPDGREVTILVTNSDDKEQRVHVNLSPDDYMAALNAHVQGQEFTVFGPLKKIGRQMRMEHATHLFKRIEQGPRLITD